jgi:2-aminobenzoate-CoA ligase
MTHPAVPECGVVGTPDAERGQIVKAYVVLRSCHVGDVGMARRAVESRPGSPLLRQKPR